MTINPAFSGVGGRGSCRQALSLCGEAPIFKGFETVDKCHIFLSHYIKIPPIDYKHRHKIPAIILVFLFPASSISDFGRFEGLGT